MLERHFGDLNMRFGIGKIHDDLDLRIVHEFFHAHSLNAGIMILHPFCSGFDLIRTCDNIDDSNLFTMLSI